MTDQPSVRQFDVHLFAVLRLEVPGVDAASHREAVETALAQVDLYSCLESSDCKYAEELSHFLVDVVGKLKYEQSQWFYSQDAPLMSNLARLVTWYDRGRSEDELQQIIRDARDVLENSI